MEIAFLLPSDRISGGSFVVYEHGIRLKRMGHNVRIIFRFDAKHPGPSSLADFDLASLSWEEAQREHFDVVVATWWETVFDISQIPSAAYAYFVQSDERRFYPPENHLDPALVSVTYAMPVPIITEAKWIQQLFKDEFKRLAALAPNGVSLDVFYPDTPLEKKGERLRILVEGPGQVAYKRVGLCFEVLNRVADIEVWYVSTDGFVDETWKCAKIFPPQSRSDMRRIYSSCDVLLKLSTVEGFFCPPLEMMACGGTVVVSRVTGSEEFVRHEENGLIVDIDDADGAVESLCRLRDDRAYLERLKANGLTTARGLTWEVSTPRFESFLRDCVEQQGKQGEISSLPRMISPLARSLSVLRYPQVVGADYVQYELQALLRTVVDRFEQLPLVFASKNLEGAFDAHSRVFSECRAAYDRQNEDLAQRVRVLTAEIEELKLKRSLIRRTRRFMGRLKRFVKSRVTEL